MAREPSEETSETRQGKARTPLTMIIPAAVLVVAAIGVVFAPHIGTGVEGAAVRFEDQAAYNATVLSGARAAPRRTAPPPPRRASRGNRDRGGDRRGLGPGRAGPRLLRAVLATAAGV